MVRVTSLDWKKIAWDNLGPEDFVYFDPPYLGTEVKSYGSSGVNHQGLMVLLKKAKFRWMLSGYHHGLYVQELGEPFFTENVHPKMANYHESVGQERRLECVWKNY